MSTRGIPSEIFDPPTPPHSTDCSRSQSPFSVLNKFKPLRQKVLDRYESKDPFFSFEFFPPRTANGALNLLSRSVDEYLLEIYLCFQVLNIFDVEEFFFKSHGQNQWYSSLTSDVIIFVNCQY